MVAVAVVAADMAAATAAEKAVAVAGEAAEASVADNGALPNKQEPANAGSFHGERWMAGIPSSVAHEQGHQGIGPHLTAPVPMNGGIKGGPIRQGVRRIEKFAWPKNARTAILQDDFHLPPQHKQPLRMTGAVKGAAKPDGALAQLACRSGHQGGQLALRCAFGQRHPFIAKTRTTIGVGEENDFFQLGHGELLMQQMKRRLSLSFGLGRTRDRGRCWLLA